ncbi:MAG: hypothetical protein OXH48_00165, partial [Chloroflexi bacterium]|nr:hypothetical protein [Chloroflexota bacterium]
YAAIIIVQTKLDGIMATAVAPPPAPKEPRTLSLEGLVTIAGAVILFLTIVSFNLALIFHLDTKIDGVRIELEDDIISVRTELKAEIDSARSDVESVRTELKADIQRLEADIQRLDDRLFAVLAPPQPEDEPEASS